MQETPLYSLSNKVIDGIKRGRKIGFPTANLEYPLKDKEHFEYGVYAVKIVIDNKNHIGVANVGIPLTFHEETPRIDVHILDFDHNIYNKTITVEFWEKIRDIKRFLNEQQLIWQIEEDIKIVRSYFNNEN